ncbi:class I mannose-6-phosphate isomerase [Clostridium sp. MSJ-4]|uniref:Phosphohexomutase n=1 Tax=Clostridium simiarum TaxID=2841506 RepID=A0ABS6EWI6_9CLOT|nr:type I phosphomannose isomerase catalytic subunit [Clostridium simiarum]MBU5590441.1 class I mannose-6-phosphate isomerase [Clostridium simiarum]
MYPIKFENIYFEKIWGGRDLELFRGNLPKGHIGESWDIACHPHGIGIVSNGKFKGISFDKLIEEQGEKLIGKDICKEKFPLLLKLINAKDKLSVQVHPNDKYGLKVEGELGKTEAWYVIEAFEGANLIVGTKECTKKQFESALKNGKLDPYLNKVEVKKGDVFFVKSGLVHAIGEGVVIAEIQQNSDTTYRVYDYNRGREIHVEKALDVIDFSLKGEKSKGLKVQHEGYTKTYHCVSPYFSLEIYDIEHKVEEKSDENRFYIFTCVEGQGEIEYKDGSEAIVKGESILIPATLGKYTIKGEVVLLKTYVPEVEELREEILKVVEK